MLLSYPFNYSILKAFFIQWRFKVKQYVRFALYIQTRRRPLHPPGPGPGRTSNHHRVRRQVHPGWLLFLPQPHSRRPAQTFCLRMSVCVWCANFLNGTFYESIKGLI
jgi:hypothetical protein